MEGMDMDSITYTDRGEWIAPLLTLTYATPRTGSLGIRDYIEPRREYVGLTLLPAAIREAMQSGGVVLRLRAPEGVAA